MVGVYQSVLPSIMWQLVLSKNRCPFRGGTINAKFLSAYRQYKKWAKENNIVAKVRHKFKKNQWRKKAIRAENQNQFAVPGLCEVGCLGGVGGYAPFPMVSGWWLGEGAATAAAQCVRYSTPSYDTTSISNKSDIPTP